MVAVAGWKRIGPDPAIADWAAAAWPLAREALAQTEQPLRCGGTWAVGLELLDNDAAGTVAGCAFPWAVLPLRQQPLHRGQLSAVYPGYPQPSAAETEAAFRFRRHRDAAHLDGLLPVGPARRRMLQEPHAWILGLPLTACDAGAAPLVVWEGSHEIIRAAFWDAFGAAPAQEWDQLDLTDVYTAARARVFEICPRVELSAQPGEAILPHRMTIHGVAPWAAGAVAPPEGRIIAYFRPLMENIGAWITAP